MDEPDHPGVHTVLVNFVGKREGGLVFTNGHDGAPYRKLDALPR